MTLEEEGEDEEDFDFSDEVGEGARVGAYRRSLRAAWDVVGDSSSRPALDCPSEGLLLLSADDSGRTLAPASLLPVLARLVLNDRCSTVRRVDVVREYLG